MILSFFFGRRFCVFYAKKITAKYIFYLRKKVGGMNLNELPGLDALTLPGAT